MSLASSSITTSDPPSSEAHTLSPCSAWRPNGANRPDSERQAPTRSRPLVPSTVALSHLLFVAELVPISSHHRVLDLYRDVCRVEHGPQHAEPNGEPPPAPQPLPATAATHARSRPPGPSRPFCPSRFSSRHSPLTCQLRRIDRHAASC